MAFVASGPPTSVSVSLMELLKYGNLFTSVAKHPEADIRRRFGAERAWVYSLQEKKVVRKIDEIVKLLKRRGYDGKSWKDVPEGDSELDKQAEDLANLLYTQGQHLLQDYQVSQLSDVAPYFMKLYRLWVNDVGGCGPTGECTSLYGELGDPIPADFTALSSVDLDLISSFVVYFLINPVDKLIWTITKRFRRGNQDITRQEVNGRYISAFVAVLTCIFGPFSLYATVAVLDHLHSRTNQLIVMTVFSMIFSSFVKLIGRQHREPIALNAAYFAAMVFFLGNSTCNCLTS